jgi:hypothetical protein
LENENSDKQVVIKTQATHIGIKVIVKIEDQIHDVTDYDSW